MFDCTYQFLFSKLGSIHDGHDRKSFPSFHLNTDILTSFFLLRTLHNFSIIVEVTLKAFLSCIVFQTRLCVVNPVRGSKRRSSSKQLH